MTQTPVTQHYTQNTHIIESLNAFIDTLSPSQAETPQNLMKALGAIDELHIGGIKASKIFFENISLQEKTSILDIGSGLGGPARFCAAHYHCHVTGIDLTDAFCKGATYLSQRTEMDRDTAFQAGDALNMPFPDAHFDGAYTIHTAMNISDKATLYAEAARVLKQGSTFGIYDVLLYGQAEEANLQYPLPWASTPDISHLITVDTLTQLLTNSGFEILKTEDMHALALTALERGLQNLKSDPQDSFAPKTMIIGEGYIERVTNLLHNLREKRISPWQIIARKL